MVKALHGAFLGRPTLRQIIVPVPDAAGTGAALGAAGNSPAWSAWVDIGLPAVFAQETLVVGMTIDTLSALGIATIDIGTTLSVGVNYATAAAVTAAGVAAIAGAHRMEIRVDYAVVTVTAVGTYGYLAGNIPLLYPIYVPAGVGVIARWQTQAGAQTANLTVMCLQGWR